MASVLTRAHRLIGGIDDAGRGPVIGPLVIAGATFHEDQVGLLKDLGVKDSKVLSASKREQLAGEIRKLATTCHQVEISPEVVDPYVFSRQRLFKLNYLEARSMAEVVNALNADEVYVDASDVNESRFGEQILELVETKVPITSRHHADATYPVVSAASILAKVHRDSSIARLRENYGDFGSGYPSDPKTKEFLRNWRIAHGEYPPIVRRSWKTLKRVEAEIYQQKLY